MFYIGVFSLQRIKMLLQINFFGSEPSLKGNDKPQVHLRHLENLVCAIGRSDKGIDGFKTTPAGRE